MTKKLKNILVKLELDGRGVVNFDSNDQKYLALKTETLKTDPNNSNVMFAKKAFTVKDVTADGKLILDYKLKISSNSLNNNIFGEHQVENNSAIEHHKMLLYLHMASIPSILRGYLWANSGFKKNGALTICDAIQTNNSQSSLEIFTKSGVKKSNVAGDKKDTSLFYKETIGDINYETIGCINLSALQFVSCDSLFDRMAFNSDDFGIYREYLCRNLPNSDYIALDYYLLNNTIVNIPEYGILFSNENIVYMVRDQISKLLNIGIYKKGGYAKTKSLKIKFVYDSLIDTFENNDGWVTIKSLEDINSINFETNFIYSPVDREESLRIRKEFEMQQKVAKEKDRIKSEEKKELARQRNEEKKRRAKEEMEKQKNEELNKLDEQSDEPKSNTNE